MSIIEEPTFLKEQKRVVLKQDLVIMPCLALGLFFAYLVCGTFAANPSTDIPLSLELGSRSNWKCSSVGDAGRAELHPSAVLQLCHDVLSVFQSSDSGFGPLGDKLTKLTRRWLHAFRLSCGTDTSLRQTSFRHRHCFDDFRHIGSLARSGQILRCHNGDPSRYWIGRVLRQRCLDFCQPVV